MAVKICNIWIHFMLNPQSKAHKFIASIEKSKVFKKFFLKLQKCNYGTLSRKISSVGSISRVASPYRPLLWQNRILMSGSCHFDRASNNKFGVEFWMFVFVMFLGHLHGIIRVPLLKRDNFELIWTSFRSDIYVGWKKIKTSIQNLKINSSLDALLKWHDPHRNGRHCPSSPKWFCKWASEQ